MAVARRQYLQERAPSAADFDDAPLMSAIAVEPTSGWWSSNGKWGNRFQGTLGPVGEPIAILNLDKAPGPPRPLAIQLLRSNRNIVNFASQNSEVYARITYGAGGVSNTFDVDWGEGQIVNVVGNSVRVDALPYKPLSDPYVAAENIVLGATIGLGSAGCRCPTLTIPTPLPITTGSPARRYAFPEYAKGLSVISQDYSSDAANITYSLRGYGVIPIWNGNADSIKKFETAPGLQLPATASFLEIRNTSAIFTSINPTIVFHLGL